MCAGVRLLCPAGGDFGRREDAILVGVQFVEIASSCSAKFLAADLPVVIGIHPRDDGLAIKSWRLADEAREFVRAQAAVVVLIKLGEGDGVARLGPGQPYSAAVLLDLGLAELAVLVAVDPVEVGAGLG